MDNQSVVFQRPIFGKNALLRAFKRGYTARHLVQDLGAGITVGIVALPLSMALAIASGVPPQHGLYTAIVAGAIIATLGGAPVSVSGPTAAFVVLLFPISAHYGIAGLLIATMMAGVFQLIMGFSGMGRLVSYVPYPVTTGFTAGIGLTIAVLQLRDFFGLTLPSNPDHMLEKLSVLVEAWPTHRWPDIAVGCFTLAILIAWRKLNTRIPGPLVAIALATFGAWLLHRFVPGFDVVTIGSRFKYVENGVEHAGIPSHLPHFGLPWLASGPDGKPLGISLDIIRELIPSGIAIAALGAIESLLCAVAVQGMRGGYYDPDAELVGHGVGNLIVPFFGGFAATAAIARTAAGIRAAAHSPLTPIIHSAFLLIALPLLTPVLGLLPMSSLAALLILVAWNMADVKHVAHIFHVAPKSDRIVLVLCLSLTFIFDMVVAVSVGVVLASLLFMRRMSEIAWGRAIDAFLAFPEIETPEGVIVYNIAGPLFFGAAEKALESAARLHVHGNLKVVVINMESVPVMDVTGLVALESTIDRLHKAHARVILAGVQSQPRTLLDRSIARTPKRAVEFTPNVQMALHSTIEADGGPASVTKP